MSASQASGTGDAARGTPALLHHYPPGFRPRRGLNWVALGLMYASYYMCRYNFRFATPGMVEEFKFSTTAVSDIVAWWSVAYGTGQLVNGLLSDRIGGKLSMLIGALGTIVVNLVFGFASFPGTVATFALISLFNGYLQAFGAPGMVKINAAWFNPTERGVFSGIFGFMIQLGQMGINNLAPIILAGFTIGTWTVAKGEWRWLFRIPPLFTAAAAVFMILAAKPSPASAGFPGVINDGIDDSEEVTVGIWECFRTIFRHPLVWFYAVAYACTGAVRQSSDQLSILYFSQELGLDMNTNPKAVMITMNLMPWVAVAGSLAAGIISDKVFKGRRAPVAMVLYFLGSAVPAAAALLSTSGSKAGGVFLACFLLVLISLTVNSTHSIVGAAAPMDIGGKKMAGFACGVIDSFQYYGGALALMFTGRVLDATKAEHGWLFWYVIMCGFSLIGGLTMLFVMRKQKRTDQALRKVTRTSLVGPASAATAGEP